MWDITGNICERAHGNLWGFIQEKFVGAQYHGEYLSNVWKIFMWAQNNVWTHMGIFCEQANEIKAQKFVPQQRVAIACQISRIS